MKKMKLKISPSIMCADFLNLEKDIKKLEEGRVDYLHFDIMDGSFVPNYTMGPDMLKAIRKITDLPFDIHLMINEPIRYIEQFAQFGNSIIVVHAEATVHLHRTLLKIKDSGAKAGVALNPATPLCFLDNIISDVDMVLIMTVNPGFAGQPFIPSMVEKVRKLKEDLEKKGLDGIEIQCDGNINDETIRLLSAAGANVFVCGTSSIFKKGRDIKETIRQLKTFLKGLEK